MSGALGAGPGSEPGTARSRSSAPRRGILRPVALRLAAVVLLAVGTLAVIVPSAQRPAPRPPVQPPGSYFALTPPSSQHPTDQSCARRVNRSSWEPRPENYLANQTVPSELELGPWGGFAPESRRLLDRVTGNATGTTDEIIQWGACKWGFPDDVVRAMAVRESGWSQSMLGDYKTDTRRCTPGFRPPCPTSFGLLQLKWYYLPGSHPWSQRSTAFNVDYALARLRSCFEGHVTFFAGDYGPGDLWGCVGAHYSGEWKSTPGELYALRVRRVLSERSWEEIGSARQLRALPTTQEPVRSRRSAPTGTCQPCSGLARTDHEPQTLGSSNPPVPEEEPA